MTVRIELAQTIRELDEVFKLRHRVMVDEQGYLEPRASGRVLDRFDASPGVATVTARVGDELVGSMRVMESRAHGTSADDYFDFGPHLRGTERLGAGSHLVVRKAYRAIPDLTISMVAMSYGWAIERGLTHLIGAANPVIVSRFVDSGWKPLGKVFYDLSHGLWVQPILLDLSELAERFRDLVEANRGKRVVTLDMGADDFVHMNRIVA